MGLMIRRSKTYEAPEGTCTRESGYLLRRRICQSRSQQSSVCEFEGEAKYAMHLVSGFEPEKLALITRLGGSDRHTSLNQNFQCKLRSYPGVYVHPVQTV